MKCVLLRGVSGSGKSSHANKLAEKAGRSSFICSADKYFTDSNGNYHFIHECLDKAHEYCFTSFVQSCHNMTRVIIIDNTNTQLHEISPYLAYAKFAGYKVEIVRMSCILAVASERNIHKVPLDVILRQGQRFQNLPSYWPLETVVETNG